MFIRVRHRLRYTYDRPVFLEPTVVRLTPRQDCAQRLLRHGMRFDPSPDGAAWSVEPDGTDARWLWFSGEHGAFTVECDSVVETLRENPFDAIIAHGDARTLPASYPPAAAAALAPMLARAGDPEVSRWSSGIAAEVGGETAAFLMRLTGEIHGGFRIVERQEGDPHEPGRALAERCGACRDVTALFIAACREQNLAARFVSGYSLHHPENVARHELHAWAEVYLPGAGWRGYDPSLGLAVADGHVALASGPDHALAAPVSGTYRGTGVGSRLDYEIVLESGGSADALLNDQR